VYQGDYPSLMRERCGNRLPRFTADQRSMLVGSADFFGLNHYSRCVHVWFVPLLVYEGGCCSQITGMCSCKTHVWLVCKALCLLPYC
jgi:hypothetical protein